VTIVVLAPWPSIWLQSDTQASNASCIPEPTGDKSVRALQDWADVHSIWLQSDAQASNASCIPESTGDKCARALHDWADVHKASTMTWGLYLPSEQFLGERE